MRRRYACVLLLLCFFTLASPFSSISAHADGGALNLAYVSGTTGGISVIDVGQAKVTKTIVVAGDAYRSGLAPMAAIFT